MDILGGKKGIYFREFCQNSRNFLPAKISSLEVYKVAKSHGSAVRLTDFDVVTLSHGGSKVSHGFINFLTTSPKFCELKSL